MKISNALKMAVARLKDVGIDSAALDSRILVESATGKNRAQIIAHDDENLSQQQLEKLEEMLSLRESRVPISQILGSKEFYGRDFVVDGNVLTPRPETEFMIDAVKNIFGANEKLRILDLGVGSGCILLTLLLELPNSSGVGADISKKAIAIAEKNKYILGVEGAELICSDWLEAVENGANFDVILSNPPYISKTDKIKLERELSFEPETALFAGEDGLDCYRNIADSINKVNFKYLILEIGQSQENEIIKIFEKQQVKFLTQYQDLAGIVRTLVFKK